MDTISLHQAGFDSAVASLGTSLTQEHAQLLSRYFKEAVIAYDGDGAGVAAAQRAIPLLEKAGLKVRVLKVTGAKDPDEFIKAYGPDAFLRLLDQSENQVDYRLEQLRSKYDLKDDAQRVSFLQEAAQLLSTLPSPVEREIYGGHAAQMAGISPEGMALEVQNAFQRRVWKQRRQQERRDLTPAVQLQPRQRGLRYQNIRSAPGGGGDFAAADAGPLSGVRDGGPLPRGLLLPPAGQGVRPAAPPGPGRACPPSSPCWRRTSPARRWTIWPMWPGNRSPWPTAAAPWRIT